MNVLNLVDFHISYFSFQLHRELGESIENVWAQVKSVIVTKLQEKEQVLSTESENVLKDQIVSLANKDSPVRKLMWKRLVAYVRLVKSGKTLPPVPPGYTDITDNLQALATSFKRLTIYNYSVFGEHCEKILEQLSQPTTENSSNANANTNADADANTTETKSEQNAPSIEKPTADAST